MQYTLTLFWLCFGSMAKYSTLETLLCKYSAKCSFCCYNLSIKCIIEYTGQTLGLRNSAGKSEIKQDIRCML